VTSAASGREVEAVVMGRVNVDLYPAPGELRKPLRSIEHYDRFVGGFAANVATGLARLGARVVVASRVGDDGHGEHVREWLAAEGVDVRWLRTDPQYRTPVTFCEIWPPDRFPITFYRHPTCPDWRLEPGDLDVDAVARAPMLFASGTALARSPSAETTLEALQRHEGTTLFDLDHRPTLWTSADDYIRLVTEACRSADVVIGTAEEMAAATGRADEASAAEALRDLGPKTVVAKRGPDGCAVYEGGEHTVIPGRAVEVVNGLGAGDAFAAAFGFGVLRGLGAAAAADLGNAAGALVAAQIPCSAAMPTLAALQAFAGRTAG
jgi:5-dehydro-2-deoxygluconokinase